MLCISMSGKVIGSLGEVCVMWRRKIKINWRLIMAHLYPIRFNIHEYYRWRRLLHTIQHSNLHKLKNLKKLKKKLKKTRPFRFCFEVNQRVYVLYIKKCCHSVLTMSYVVNIHLYLVNKSLISFDIIFWYKF